MPTKPDSSTATVGDMTTAVQDIDIDAKTTEGVADQRETRFQNTDWTTYYGMYKTQPELKIALDTLGIWVVGKGYETPDARTEIILEGIRGCGTDNFNSILWNMVVTAAIGGDSYAEIIKSNNQVVNLKPLDPGSMVVIANRQGVITRYEQVTKRGGKSRVAKFTPDQIFHFSTDRIADNILSNSKIEAIQEIIKANNESFVMQKRVVRRFGVPRFNYYLKTDNQTKITDFKDKADSATNLGENIYMADEVVKAELISVPEQATKSIISWREHLRTYFWQVVGIPQIIVGSSGEFTESTAKIAYVSYMQLIRTLQRNVMDQVWNQLYLRIELKFPFEFRNELIQDEQKDGAQGLEGQPSDTTVGEESGT